MSENPYSNLFTWLIILNSDYREKNFFFISQANRKTTMKNLEDVMFRHVFELFSYVHAEKKLFGGN